MICSIVSGMGTADRNGTASMMGFGLGRGEGFMSLEECKISTWKRVKGSQYNEVGGGIKNGDQLCNNKDRRGMKEEQRVVW